MNRLNGIWRRFPFTGLKPRRILPPLPWILFLFSAFWLASCARHPSAPPAMPNIDRTTGPELPANPSQSDLGSVTYWQICMACHGNRGQGLTDEWRQSWGPQEMNCWQSKCHASNHPPQGFEFPHTVPAVTGPDALIRFKTADELYIYIKDTMPWWNPGSLSDDQSWNVTAYLLKAQGALPDGVTLDATNAAVFPIHQRAPAPNADRPALLILSAVLVGAAVMFFFIRTKG